MSGACASAVGEGVIRGVLAAVDCQTREVAQSGYLALTADGSPFQTALTALLTIYVALVGWRMLFARGETSLTDALSIALRAGVVLALATSWASFQTVVFELAAHAPREIAAVVSAPLQAQGAELARSPVDGLQAAYDQLSRSALAFGKAAGPVAKGFSSPEAAAAEALSGATAALFMGGAGVISVAVLAIGVLTAVGPVFVALFLLPATRGLFTGWLRALAAAALLPMGAWVLNVTLLVVLEPWLVALADQGRRQVLDPQTAMSASAVVFVFMAAQGALAIAACVIAFSLRLASARPAASAVATAPSIARTSEVAPPFVSRAQALAFHLQRDAEPQRLAAIRRSSAAAGYGMPSGRGAPEEAAAPRLGDVYRRRPASAGAPARERLA